MLSLNELYSRSIFFHQVPDYLDIVKCPMDFSTIKRKLNTFEYNNNEDFLTDVRLVFSNSEQYNMVSACTLDF